MFNLASEDVYQDGEIIIREGTTGDWVYVVLSGTVEISKTVEGKKFVIELLPQGEIFGELGFLGNVKRTATARAIGETRVGVIDRGFLDQEYNKLYSDFRAILNAVVDRFKKMTDRASEFSSPKEIRILDTLTVTYKNRESFLDAYNGNLSSGGIFISTKNPRKQGEQFLLKLRLPTLEDSVKIKCEVVRAKENAEDLKDSPLGMEVKFIDMTKKNHQMLKSYLVPVHK